MIKKINVQKFGLFENYLWDNSIGKDYDFKKLNIIYGRNYSGKTTLSRIFRCIELGNLHDDYLDCDFKIKLDDNSEITHTNFHTFQNRIRVYNTDFVNDNLNWLHNTDGTIKPFTILGAVNVEIEKRITEINDLLGSEEEQKGLFYQRSLLGNGQKNKYDLIKGKRDSLSKKLTDKAREIKNKAGLFNVPTYQINSIKDDISSVAENSILSEEDLEKFNKLLKEEPRITLLKFTENQPNFSKYFTQAKDLIEKNITPSKPLTELLNNSILQEWVRSGINLHKDKLTNCGFCGGVLPAELWKELDAHFSKESEDLRSDIQNLILTLEGAKNTLSNYITLNKENFYNGLRDEVEKLQALWNDEVTIYNSNLDKLIESLQDRLNDIFRKTVLDKIIGNAEEVHKSIIAINGLIEKNNKKTESLSADQNEARKSLRINEVAKFAKDIDYSALNLEIDQSLEEYNNNEPELEKLIKTIEELHEEKRKLEADAKDESKGAELVNQHLTHFFGNDELKLVAEGDSVNIKFKITRSNLDAKNLSEGECSLISFCYFIAKIEDELKEEANVNKLILYIDDPISSLDSNHIFFMFSLIEGIIAKPQKYNQLFISTHNLDFLKYLKKLTIPKEKAQSESKPKNSINHLMIERRSKNHSVLKFAPKYLRDYITEFNYLFEQMYQCAEKDIDEMDHNYQYNFGNNARKFLESYLYYKFPDHALSNDQRLDLFFENDTVTISLIRRVINEYSHLENQFDRALEPIDETVIKKVALAIMNKIKATDPQQYNSLEKSITS